MDIANTLTCAFVREHPLDAARILESVSPDSAAAVMVLSTGAEGAATMAALAPAVAAALLHDIPVTQGAALIAAMPRGAAGLVLRRLAAGARQALLDALPQDVSRLLKRALDYPSGSAGANAESAVLTVPEDISIGQALGIVSHAENIRHAHLYVIGRDQKPIGTLTLRELMAAPAKALVADHVAPLGKILKAASPMPGPDDERWDTMGELAVIDSQGHFLGIALRTGLTSAQPDTPSLPGENELVDGLLTVSEYCWTGLAALLDVASSPTTRKQHPPRP